MHSILQSSSSLRDRKLKRVSKVRGISICLQLTENMFIGLGQNRSSKCWQCEGFCTYFGSCIRSEGEIEMGNYDGLSSASYRITRLAFILVLYVVFKPLLSDSKSQVPPRIIHSIEKSRPPVYSPELKALLMSNLARKVKPLASSSLIFPPTLPLRADPSSVDARLLGPLSKRREVNIRWRYFSANWKKIRPPLQVVVEETSAEASPCSTHTNTQRAGIRGFGMQGQKVQEDIETIVGPTWMPRAPTLKEQRTTGISTAQEGVILSRHPSRWLRRRYQELLGRIPILTLSRDKDGHTPGKYSVSLSPNSLAPTLRNSPRPKMEAEDIDNQAWLKMALAGHRREGKSIRE